MHKNSIIRLMIQPLLTSYKQRKHTNEENTQNSPFRA
jgi:hypothetical protein